MNIRRNRWIRSAAVIAFWLTAWQAASLAIDNSIIFAGPLEVAAALRTQAASADFWKTIGWSVGKIGLGFLLAFFLGLILGSLAYRHSFLKELFAPLFSFMKSVPVASFVILALIWMGSKNLSIFISFVVVLPIIYVSTISGLSSADPKLLEMAGVFQVSPWKRVVYIYRPALIPYLSSACKTALGLSWKSGVAAEVIGVPDYSIGGQLYMAKIYLATADLFAWTLVIILISVLFERLFLTLLEAFGTSSRKGRNL